MLKKQINNYLALKNKRTENKKRKSQFFGTLSNMFKNNFGFME